MKLCVPAWNIGWQHECQKLVECVLVMRTKVYALLVVPNTMLSLVHHLP